MKRIFKNPIFMFILGLVLATTISVVATTISSHDITYKNTTVENAIDNLYTRATTYKKLDTLTNELTSGDLLSGKQAYKSNGTVVNGNISTYGGSTTVTPTLETQTLSTAGKYLTSNITIDPLTTGNIQAYYTSINSATRPASPSASINLTKGSYLCEFAYSGTGCVDNKSYYKDLSVTYTVTGCDSEEVITSHAKSQSASTKTGDCYQSAQSLIRLFKCNLNSNKTVTVSTSGLAASNNQGILATIMCAKY